MDAHSIFVQFKFLIGLSACSDATGGSDNISAEPLQRGSRGLPGTGARPGRRVRRPSRYKRQPFGRPRPGRPLAAAVPLHIRSLQPADRVRGGPGQQTLPSPGHRAANRARVTRPEVGRKCAYGRRFVALWHRPLRRRANCPQLLILP